jgi:O-antigen ligase
VIAVANIAVAGPEWATGHFNVITPPVAIYDTANAVPLYLEPLVAFGLALVFFSDDRRERALAAVFVLIAALAIFFSYSRAGWLTLFALVGFVALFTRVRWWLVGGIVAISAVLFAGSHSVRDRILVQFDFHNKDNTIGLRLDLWRSALAMLSHHPLFGGGLSGFKQSLRPYRVSAYHENLIYPHNLFLNFWSETGLLGLAALCWLLIQIVRTALRGLRIAESPWARAMAVGLLGVVVAFLLHGMVDVPYFKNDQALAFWALLGVQLGSLQLQRGGARR